MGFLEVLHSPITRQQSGRLCDLKSDPKPKPSSAEKKTEPKAPTVTTKSDGAEGSKSEHGFDGIYSPTKQFKTRFEGRTVFTTVDPQAQRCHGWIIAPSHHSQLH
ncbi:hypothetical protein BU23DRAFT_247621 [Bimuria novae-zelandiae CBS 107.79]|uniref:Uncharacterized protein n=1 Tax=Bimuria novae-zelandiae CBS 107.79 TaxID=1447943 RepID=A0A6A5UYV2_9PLEO|nr:hypothetical protein BU23DRAFT_247621 [Bimuria novae-zelandiae CBS 107.79]